MTILTTSTLLQEQIKARQAKLVARKTLVEQRATEFMALPEETRALWDSKCMLLREAFGNEAEWRIYGEPMPMWENLPEENKQSWRAVARLVDTQLAGE